jgi:hypothetical protein
MRTFVKRRLPNGSSSVIIMNIGLKSRVLELQQDIAITRHQVELCTRFPRRTTQFPITSKR